jgi:hypothetical protein
MRSPKTRLTAKKTADALDELEPKGKLNYRQEQFCQELLVDRDARQAWLRAGYSVKSADSGPYTLLRRPYIRARVEELLAQRAARLRLTTDKVLLDLHQAFQQCLEGREVMDKEGNPTGMWVFNATGAAQLGRLVLSNLPGGVGDRIAPSQEFDVTGFEEAKAQVIEALRAGRKAG